MLSVPVIGRIDSPGGSQDGLHLQQGVAVDGRHDHQPQRPARRWLEHPGGNFEGSSTALLIEAAATHGMSAPCQNFVHRDRAPAPRMPRIYDASRLSTMGVVLSTSITRNDRIKLWPTSSSRRRPGCADRAQSDAMRGSAAYSSSIIARPREPSAGFSHTTAIP